MKIVIELDYLTPAQLSRLAAITSQAAYEMYDEHPARDYETMATAAKAASIALHNAVGTPRAMEYLMEDGAMPQVLFE